MALYFWRILLGGQPSSIVSLVLASWRGDVALPKSSSTALQCCAGGDRTVHGGRHSSATMGHCHSIIRGPAPQPWLSSSTLGAEDVVIDLTSTSERPSRRALPVGCLTVGPLRIGAQPCGVASHVIHHDTYKHRRQVEVARECTTLWWPARRPHQ